MKKLNQFIPASIQANISRNTRIRSIVCGCLPGDIAGRVSCIGSPDGYLGLLADSAAVASQLRFCTAPILAALHQAGFTQYRQIRISSRSAQTQHASQTTVLRPSGPLPCLSNQAAQSLRSTASAIEDRRLCQAMQRLASLGEKNRLNESPMPPAGTRHRGGTD